MAPTRSETTPVVDQRSSILLCCFPAMSHRVFDSGKTFKRGSQFAEQVHPSGWAASYMAAMRCFSSPKRIRDRYIRIRCSMLRRKNAIRHDVHLARLTYNWYRYLKSCQNQTPSLCSMSHPSCHPLPKIRIVGWRKEPTVRLLSWYRCVSCRCLLFGTLSGALLLLILRLLLLPFLPFHLPAMIVLPLLPIIYKKR